MTTSYEFGLRISSETPELGYSATFRANNKRESIHWMYAHTL